MNRALEVRAADGRPMLVALEHNPSDLLFIVPDSTVALSVQLCPAELEKLARAGVRFDPAETHHRTMIDKFLAQRRLPALTGEQWSQIRKYYRALKRRTR